MDAKAKERLKALILLPKARCTKCDSIVGYTNPMRRCFECKKKFCFDHSESAVSNKTMTSNIEGRVVCFPCKKEHHYTSIGGHN